MRKILGLVFASVVTLALAACGTTGNDSDVMNRVALITHGDPAVRDAYYRRELEAARRMIIASKPPKRVLRWSWQCLSARIRA